MRFLNLILNPMEKKISLLLAMILVLSGCNWIKDLAEVEFSTDLMLDIPVTVTGTKSADQAKALNASNFSASLDLKLEDNEDIEPYLEKLRNIDLNSVMITVNGLTSGQTINTLTLEAAGVGIIFTQTNISNENNSFTPEADAAKLLQAGEKLKNDRKLTVTVSGTANSPMVFNVNLIFDADITAGALD